MSTVSTTSADPPGSGQAAVTFDLTSGRLYLRSGKVDVSAADLGVAAAILGHVVGPGGAPCVALVEDAAGPER